MTCMKYTGKIAAKSLWRGFPIRTGIQRVEEKLTVTGWRKEPSTLGKWSVLIQFC